jgi:carbon monoxide dehydrogenase subunit G
MELNNEFSVSVPVDQAWDVLTDLERVAPCLPGAQLQEVDGDEHRGIVKVKVGPITAQYKGMAQFVERDEAAHRAVLRAQGRDTRGQGNATATITATLRPAGEGTTVSIATDLQITGRVAQLGRGVLNDVSAKLLGEFAERLEADVLAGPGSAPGNGAASVADHRADGEPAPAPSPLSAVPAATADDVEPVDLIQAAGGSIAKRVVPLVLTLLVLVAGWRLLRRRRRT